MKHYITDEDIDRVSIKTLEQVGIFYYRRYSK